MNTATPQASALPRADRDAMDEFAENIRTLLGVLGHRVLDSIGRSKTVHPEAKPGEDRIGSDEPAANPSLAPVFCLKNKRASAKALRTEEGIMVLAGSYASQDELDSLSSGVKKLRRTLVDKGVLRLEGNSYVFTKDYLFNSPSQAAATIVGHSINGQHHWQTPDGTTYKAIEEAEAKVALEESAEAPPLPQSS